MCPLPLFIFLQIGAYLQSNWGVPGDSSFLQTIKQQLLAGVFFSKWHYSYSFIIGQIV